MPLPVVPTDSPNDKQHRAVIATSLNELVKFYNTIASGSWTPVIRGSGTAGTYEIQTNNCRYSRIGRRVFLDVWIQLAAVITGGGTGYMQITGAPFAKIANTFPIGSVFTEGLDFTTAGASLTMQFTTGLASTSLYIHENVDNTIGNDFQISGISASDRFFGSVCYETEDL